MDEAADLEGIDEEFERDAIPSFPLAVVSVMKRRWGKFVFRVDIVSGIHRGRDSWVWTRLPRCRGARYSKVWDVIAHCIPFEMPDSEIISDDLITSIVDDTYDMEVDPYMSISYGIRQLWGT